MELSEFESVLSELDAQIEGAKEKLERKAQREVLQKKLREAARRCSAIDSRIASLRQLGDEPGEHVLAFAARLRSEADAIRTELFSFDPEAANKQAVEPPTLSEMIRPLDAAEKKALLDLMIEIEGVSLDKVPQAEKEPVVTSWAIRWRILADQFGRERTKADRDAQRCYGWISGAREKHIPGIFIPALNKDTPGDWQAILAKTNLNLLMIRSEQIKKEEAEKEWDNTVMKLADVMGVFPDFKVLQGAAESEEGRRFRHLLRELAKNESRRPELAELCRSYRNALEPEFSFLWKDENADDDPDCDPGKHLSNIEIVQRLLGRMIRKGIIGGRTAPTAMLLKGFPPHDLGRAKEAFDLLSKAEIIHQAKEGNVASITADVCHVAKALVDGCKSRIAAVDEWAGI